MKDPLTLLANLLTTIARPTAPSDAKTIVADSLLVQQQLLIIINRFRQR
jgi:hypothetical protein